MVYSKSTSTYPYSWHQYSNNHTYSVMFIERTKKHTKDSQISLKSQAR